MHQIRAFCMLLVVILWGCEGKETAEEPAQQTNVEALDPSEQEVTFWYQHTRERETA